jgi:outer membrane protein
MNQNNKKNHGSTKRQQLQRKALAAALLATASLGAQAQDLRVGVIHIDPSVSSAGIKGLNQLGSLLAQPGYNATLGKASTLLLTYEHRFGDQLGVELVVGLPPKHDIIGAGTLKPGQKIGSLKQLTPALLLNYHFADHKATWRPTIGIGPLFSTIRDVQIDPTVQPNTTAKADNKWGVVAHAALSYAIDDRWHLVGALGYSRVKNSITLSTDTSKPPYTQLGLPAGTALSGLDVTTKNTTLSLTLGYSF